MATLGVPRWSYAKGVHEVGNGVYAYLQPDGSWGWSNAGLVVDGDRSLLVDTLFDLALTREMLAALRDAAPRATARFDTLVNTHANGDHCHGNELVEGAEIIASAATAEEMAAEGPEVLAAFKKAAPQMGAAGEFFLEAFGPFEFEGIAKTLPTRTFTGELSLAVGDRRVDLVEVGPCHTRGDVLVHVPDARTIYTGDVLFIDGTPIMWAGPVANWIAACDRMLAMDLEAIVPGHGPITDARGVRAVRDYLVYVRDEAKARFDAGLGPLEAARDIALGDFDAWGDAERIVVNVATLYRELSGGAVTVALPDLFAAMAAIARDRRR
ncbi:MAG: MBL fold metallo-hydrolase [Myxococcota bacterium]|nr:MBL fold metallo-hydrolase [Myxococcales bacterium]